jgi:hypothetical protein
MLLFLFIPLAAAQPLDTSFTYQGELRQTDVLANGDFDFQFELFDSGGMSISSQVLLEGIAVTDGKFTVQLDFGISPFTGQEVLLEIGVREAGTRGAFTILSPRQDLTATPYALHAGTVSEGSITGANIVDGSVDSSEIADFGVTTIDIANNAITQAKLAPGSVGAGQIIDSEVQRRVVGACPGTSFVNAINQDGSLVCLSIYSTFVIEKQTIPDGAPDMFTFTGEVAGQLGDGEQFVRERVLGIYDVTEIDLPEHWMLTSIDCDDDNSQGDTQTGTVTIQLDVGETVTCVFTNTDFAISTITVEKQTVPDGLRIPGGFEFSGDVAGLALDDGTLSTSELIPGTYSSTESIPWSWELTDISCNDGNSSGDVPSATATFNIEFGEDVTCVLININLGGTVAAAYDPSIGFGGAGSRSSLAIGTDGFPVISARDFSAQDPGSELVVVKCNDIACLGGDENAEQFDFAPITWVISMAIGADNNPVVAYRSGATFPDFVLKVLKCDDPACSGGGEVITTVDGTAAGLGRYVSLAMGTDGNPVIAYDGWADQSIRIVKCNDPGCIGGDETMSVLNTIGFSTAPSIAIGSDTFPVISFGGDPGTTLYVAKCNDIACAGADELVSAVDSAGFNSAITISTDTFPVIAYDNSSQGLTIAKCNDIACTGGNETISLVDDNGDFTDFHSIAIGADDNPVVSYISGTTDYSDLRVAKCNDTACSGADETITEITSIPGVLEFFGTSVKIGTDSNPVISTGECIVDSPGECVLDVVHCSEPDCSR